LSPRLAYGVDMFWDEVEQDDRLFEMIENPNQGSHRGFLHARRKKVWVVVSPRMTRTRFVAKWIYSRNVIARILV
jgi:hypothetical protein